jgi:hypothetical protein
VFVSGKIFGALNMRYFRSAVSDTDLHQRLVPKLRGIANEMGAEIAGSVAPARPARRGAAADA